VEFNITGQGSAPQNTSDIVLEVYNKNKSP
jgi:hypothetical protein